MALGQRRRGVGIDPVVVARHRHELGAGELEGLQRREVGRLLDEDPVARLDQHGGGQRERLLGAARSTSTSSARRRRARARSGARRSARAQRRVALGRGVLQRAAARPRRRARPRTPRAARRRRTAPARAGRRRTRSRPAAPSARGSRARARSARRAGARRAGGTHGFVEQRHGRPTLMTPRGARFIPPRAPARACVTAATGSSSPGARRAGRPAPARGRRRPAAPSAVKASSAMPTGSSRSSTRAPMAASTLRSSAWAQTAPKRPVLAPITATGLPRSGLVASGRESQSIAFLSWPGIEWLYSGVANSTTSASRDRGLQRAAARPPRGRGASSSAS